MKRTLQRLRCYFGFHNIHIIDRGRYLRTVFKTTECLTCGIRKAYQINYRDDTKIIKEIPNYLE